MFARADLFGHGFTYARSSFLTRVLRRVGHHAPKTHLLAPPFQIGDRVEIETHLPESWGADAGVHICYGIVQGFIHNPTNELESEWRVVVRYLLNRGGQWSQCDYWEDVPLWERSPDMATTVRHFRSGRSDSAPPFWE